MGGVIVGGGDPGGVIIARPLKRVGSSTPILSWCLIVRNAEATLEATLKSIRARTPNAEIVIVDTMSRDGSKEIALRYADVWVEWAGPRGDWDRDMPWFDDAAAARQHAFELASGRWRGWIDSDDILPGPEEVERLLKLNNRWQPAQKGAKVEGAGKTQTLEDMLAFLDENYPDADCVWAPYLYQRDAADVALVWQERERIVRWDPKRWRWAEKAHEILVADGPPPPRVNFDGLLFVHEKRFTVNDTRYAMARHFDVLLKQFEAGEVTHRRAQYLGWYAREICPERELEFIRAAHGAACNSLDRYRSKIDEGSYWLKRGLYHDAIEALGAATTLLPQLPDAWAAVMLAAEQFHDDGRVIDAGERLLLCEPGQLESSVTPRQHQLEYACRLADAYKRLAAGQVAAELHDEAVATLNRVLLLEAGVMNHEAVGADHGEAQARCAKAQNELRAQQHAMALDRYLQFLCDNDEPLKAVKVLRAGLAWNLTHHPIAVRWSKKLAIVHEHYENDEAYRKFYDDKGQTGAIFSPESWLDPATGGADVVTLQRARWAADWINEHCPNGRIVDVGCFDGIVGIPLLKLCPGITYVGLDVYVPALEEFARRTVAMGLAHRTTFHAISVDALQDPAEIGGPFDAALWMELIEHVPSPKISLHRVLSLAPTALVTTPWGSFDAGHPPPGGAHGSVRDNRGHLRAYDFEAFMRDCETYRSHVVELERVPGPAAATGDSLNAVVVRETRDVTETGQGGIVPMPPPVSFAVAGALWPWNGSTVRRDGIGASEETIVYLAERLARERDVRVFGPVPEEEVCRGVAYTKRVEEQPVDLRNNVHGRAHNGPVVVSRAPTYDKVIDANTRRRMDNKILWLQDAYYPELNAEVAKRYKAVVVVSEWHKVAMHERHGVPLDLMHVIPNFVLPEHFEARRQWWGNGTIEEPMPVMDFPPRKNDHFIFASSPDRGVIRLLEVWAKIRATLPDATLSIFYGWKGAARLSVSGQYGWQQRYESQRRRFEELRHQPGVAFHGMVNHERIAREYQRAGVWLYPTKFEETCLHGDSMISVPGDHSRGGPIRARIADLVGKSGLPVYAFDAAVSRFRIATMTSCWQAKIAPEMVELTLDDGELLRCTPDHRIMNFDGEWVLAGDVSPGTRLMGLHHRYDVMIKDFDGRWAKESRLVAEWAAGRPLLSTEHVDHADPKRLDNRPEALRLLSASEHARHTHAGQRMRAKNRGRLGKWAQDPVNREVVVARAASATRVLWDRVNAMPEAERAAWCAARAAKKHQTTGQNHSVVSVRRIPGGPVFDMEVEGLHNFVADGVVVHNCCTAAIKARVAGAVPVCPPLAALAEMAGGGTTSWLTDVDDDEEIVEQCLAASQVSEADRAAESARALAAFSIDGPILSKWKALLG